MPQSQQDIIPVMIKNTNGIINKINQRFIVDDRKTITRLPPKTEDEVLAGLFVVAEGEGYIDMEWADKECLHYDREEINPVLDGKTQHIIKSITMPDNFPQHPVVSIRNIYCLHSNHHP